MKPIGKGKLGVTFFKTQPVARVHLEETIDDESLQVPFERDLCGVCMGSDEIFQFPVREVEETELDQKWRAAGVPDHDRDQWRTHGTLGYFMSCIKNPVACEPRSLVFWCHPDIKVGYDRRDGVNIFFLGWRDHLVIDLDDCPRCPSQTLLEARLKLLAEMADRQGLTFAIYRTDRGYHAIELSRSWDPTDPEVLTLTRMVGGDIRYAAISALQGWRLRLSPKTKSPDDFVIRACQPFHPVLGTLVAGSAPVSAETSEHMACYLDLAQTISNELRGRNLDDLLDSLWVTPSVAARFSNVIDECIKKYELIYKRKILDQPMKSCSAMMGAVL